MSALLPRNDGESRLDYLERLCWLDAKFGRETSSAEREDVEWLIAGWEKTIAEINAMQVALGMNVTDCLDGDSVRWCEGLMRELSRLRRRCRELESEKEKV